MFCTNCGASNPDGGKFCIKCGTPMTAPVEKEEVVAEAPVAPAYAEPVAPVVEAAPVAPAYEAPAAPVEPVVTAYSEPAAPAYEAPAAPVEPAYTQPAQPTYQQPTYQQPVYQQPVYQQPVYQHPYQMVEQPASMPVASKVMGIISMALGILSDVMLTTLFYAPIFAIPALILGIISSKKAREAGVKNGMALAGIICSAVALGIAVLIISIFVFIAMAEGGFYY